MVLSVLGACQAGEVFGGRGVRGIGAESHRQASLVTAQDGIKSQSDGMKRGMLTTAYTMQSGR